MILGIDPGKTGAMALLDGERCLGVWDMPSVSDGRSTGVSAALLSDAIDDAVQLADGNLAIVLEKVGAMPGQGTVSMFSFGRSVGIIEGVVGSKHIAMHKVSPSIWKRRAKLIGKAKDFSRALAIEMFPEVADQLQRKKDCGRADAILIAFYGML